MWKRNSANWLLFELFTCVRSCVSRILNMHCNSYRAVRIAFRDLRARNLSSLAARFQLDFKNINGFLKERSLCVGSAASVKLRWLILLVIKIQGVFQDANSFKGKTSQWLSFSEKILICFQLWFVSSLQLLALGLFLYLVISCFSFIALRFIDGIDSMPTRSARLDDQWSLTTSWLSPHRHHNARWSFVAQRGSPWVRI